MPPLKGIDRGLNGDCLKALEEIGHGAQIAVVDASYDIPSSAQIISYQGDSTAQAVTGILKLVPMEGDNIIGMAPDNHGEPCEALALAMQAANDLEIGLFGIRRLGDSEADDELAQKGFYAIANDPEKHTLFVRTRDEKAYACAMFVVGHSQQ